MRLLAIIEAITITGPAKNLLEFCRTVRRLDPGFEVSVAVFERSSGMTPFREAAGRAGIEVLAIPETSALDRGVLQRLRNVVDAKRPDIVQTHAVKSHFLLYVSRLWKRYPWIAFHHGYTTTNIKMRAYNQLDRISLRKPERVLTVSNAFARQLTDSGVAQPRITVLQNAIDTSWAERVRMTDGRQLRARLGIAPESKVLLAVGRLSLEKAHIHLVNAVRLLREQGVPVELILVGDGPERGVLERAASPAVHFIGQESDVAPYYGAADLVVLPSLTEGSPNVLLEAMAAGIPVVATAVGGIPEIVRNRESALLVPPADPAALAAGIREALADEALARALVACSEELIRSRHSPESRAGTLLKIYSGVAGGGSFR